MSTGVDREELMVTSNSEGVRVFRRRISDGYVGEFVDVDWAEAFSLMRLLAQECGQHLETTERELKRWMELG